MTHMHRTAALDRPKREYDGTVAPAVFAADYALTARTPVVFLTYRSEAPHAARETTPVPDVLNLKRASDVAWAKLQGGPGDDRCVTPCRHVGRRGSRASGRIDPFLRYCDGRIAIDAAAADGNGTGVLTALESIGLQHGAAVGAIVSGSISIDRLDALAALAELKFARPGYFDAHAGAAYSQGDAALRADDARATYGVDGSGVTVGVLSDSFNARAGYSADIASGDLPAGVRILQEGSGTSDEGRAMAQIVHDVAPGAALAFHTAWEGQANFARGILELSAVADVIVDDVFYFSEPFFQDGIVAQAVDPAVAAGDVYFSAAGNQGSRSYESPFRDSGVTATIGGFAYRLHDFDPGPGVDTRQRVSQSGDVSYILQWDQPFYSQSPWSGGAANDLDFFLFNASGTLVASSVDDNVGGDPFEYMRRVGSGNYDLQIGLYSGAAPGRIKYATVGGSFSTSEFGTASGTTTGHANAAGAIAVGAAAFYNTPAFGATPTVESYSSVGGVPILFDVNGSRLPTAVIRDKVEITAPDGGNTTFFGSDSIRDADTQPNFFGTSSAAPDAAAVAALMLELAPAATPAQIEQALKDSAIDMGPAGFDRSSGFGLVQAPAALAAIAAATAAAARASLSGTDFNGDSRADLLWHNVDGRTDVWQMAGSRIELAASLPPLPAASVIVDARGNYDADGHSDLLLRDSGGALQAWYMNGPQAAATAALGAIPLDWRVVSAHSDFDGDGRSGILWRNTDGRIGIWQMNGSPAVEYPSIPLDWYIVGADGDYNGASDILWRNFDGRVQLWEMNGGSIAASPSFGPIGSDWRVVDVAGDHNGDGRSDVLWRNVDGRLQSWQIDGSSIGLGLSTAVPSDWQVVDARGDYNGDGRSDLLWRNDDGRVDVWELAGSIVGSGSLRAVPHDWTLVDAHGDFDGDGKSDVLWRDGSGTLTLWQINGTRIAAAGVITAVPLDWSLADSAPLGALVDGTAGADAIHGTTARDTLYGHNGNDVLTGYAGADRFVFDTPAGALNRDTTSDFTPGSDTLVLSDVVYSALPRGPLAAVEFVAGSSAVARDADDFILYDTATGTVSYDADGSGPKAAIAFATLLNHPALTACDVYVGLV